MAVDVSSIWGSLRNLINEKNTTTAVLPDGSTTADISNGLTKRIQAVYKKSAKTPVPNVIYPVIFVEPKDKSKEFGALGRNSNRKNEINFDIVAISQYGLGIMDGRMESDEEMVKVADNIETLLDNYPTLSSTVDQIQVKSTVYDDSISNDTYNSVARISVMVTKYSN